MTSATEQVKTWILQRHEGLADIEPDVDLIDSRLIDSLSFVEFVFYIGQVSGQVISLDGLQIDDFRTLERITKRYLTTAG
ncbi:hypothetical protein Lfu02_02120 [Longispora fulva]|uniref:Acyl carrier protein n=1 Tax=Longispora fulva TaxID=619741 RepID=A0A8J7KVZ4_9ACTN|nr:hypothetical protein [Longispora fulva]MBG6135917.1 acyl carrier protein [Longispora fulva]GIG55840.1 hypothetical protein Lfu02_02120 [Longispora fulva]